MTRTLLLASVVGVLVALSSPAAAAGPSPGAGEQLVRNLFGELTAGNVKAVEAMLAQGFRGVSSAGAVDREKELQRRRTMKLGDFTLGDFAESREGDVLVVTYTFAGRETVGGKVIAAQPSPRLSVFVKGPAGWTWAAHANLAPPGR